MLRGLDTSLDRTSQHDWRHLPPPHESCVTLKLLRLKLDPKPLTDLTSYPMGAFVSLGGCTVSLVSPKRLAVSNHHCVYRVLQLNSTPENNLSEKGFLAKNPADELFAGSSARVLVTEKIRDVTSETTAIKAKAFDGYASPKLDALPVDFLADLDITGGKSGSPAMDAMGQLVGLAFDGS